MLTGDYSFCANILLFAMLHDFRLIILTVQVESCHMYIYNYLQVFTVTETDAVVNRSYKVSLICFRTNTSNCLTEENAPIFCLTK